MRAVEWAFTAILAITLALVANISYGAASQRALYMASNVVSTIILEIESEDRAEIKIAYVSPGSPTVHNVYLTLTKTHSAGATDYFTVVRDGHECASLSLRPSKNAKILLAATASGTQALSLTTDAEVRTYLQELERTAALQRGFPNKGLTRPYSFLVNC